MTAGGKGTRLGCMEKPMADIDGRPAIDMVVDALRATPSVDGIVVSVSDNVPMTRAHLSAIGVDVLETSGLGYVADLNDCMHRMSSDEVLVVPADVPLVEPVELERLISEYRVRECESLMLAFDARLAEDAGLEPSFVVERDGARISYCGISVVDRKAMSEDRSLDEDVMMTSSIRCALNVNTPRGLRIARDLAE